MRVAVVLLLLAIAQVGCSDATEPSVAGDPGAGGDAPSTTPDASASTSPPSSPSGRDASAPPGHDAAAPPPEPDASSPPPPPPPPPPTPDAGSPPPPDAGAPPPGDGAPTRQPCTSSFGSGLSSSHARLDGYLVTILPPGQGKQCNGDSSHVHLQVLSQGSIYDVAVNADGMETEIDAPLPSSGGAWSEGWHTQDGLDYPSQLGVHASAFTLTGLNAVATEIEQQLAQANHVAIFCTGYGPTGCHLVHRNSGRDGAVVIDPLSSTPHWLLFDFSGDSF